VWRTGKGGDPTQNNRAVFQWGDLLWREAFMVSVLIQMGIAEMGDLIASKCGGADCCGVSDAKRSAKKAADGLANASGSGIKGAEAVKGRKVSCGFFCFFFLLVGRRGLKCEGDLLGRWGS
jgi:hypothetical protein